MIHTVHMVDGFFMKGLDLKLTLNYIIIIEIKAEKAERNNGNDIQGF